MKCKDCKFWTASAKGHAYGDCSSDKFIDASELYSEHYPGLPVDGLAYRDAEQYAASFMTGAEFGCIHFENKEQNG